MDVSTMVALLLAIPVAQVPLVLVQRLLPVIRQIYALIQSFRCLTVTPQSCFEFESSLELLLREIGRLIVEWTYNPLEPDQPELLPIRLDFLGEHYRRANKKTANRHVSTLFGKITLWRFLYRSHETGEPSIIPLEIRLGLEDGTATPALADWIGRYAADCTQGTVLELLEQRHGVRWSVDKLREVTAAVSRGMSAHCHDAQVERLLDLLAQADASRGNRKPILAAGRDGVFLPIVDSLEYREGATATVSVLDRRGRRLGTVYLGRMPEAGQTTLSDQLTALLEEVLRRWTGPMPRLVYVTDAGHHPTEYYETVLKRMANPHRLWEYLEWEWVVDYYHACSYISQLAESIFGRGREAQSWAAKMRRWLKDKPNGIHRLLHSAAAMRHKRGLTGKKEDYRTAYDYLKNRIGFMNYVDYHNRHLPIGSGITEAACKIVFTQRIKQAGMKWKIESGQWIIDLRVIHLSDIWSEVRQAYLRSKPLLDMGTQTEILKLNYQKAA